LPSHSNLGVAVRWPLGVSDDASRRTLTPIAQQACARHGFEISRALVRPGGKEIEIEQMYYPPRARHPDGRLVHANEADSEAEGDSECPVEPVPRRLDDFLDPETEGDSAYEDP
jgi:hypothetical protein